MLKHRHGVRDKSVHFRGTKTNTRAAHKLKSDFWSKTTSDAVHIKPGRDTPVSTHISAGRWRGGGVVSSPVSVSGGSPYRGNMELRGGAAILGGDARARPPPPSSPFLISLCRPAPHDAPRAALTTQWHQGRLPRLGAI